MFIETNISLGYISCGKTTKITRCNELKQTIKSLANGDTKDEKALLAHFLKTYKGKGHLTILHLIYWLSFI